jgi:hypothetical protein
MPPLGTRAGVGPTRKNKKSKKNGKKRRIEITR